MDTSGWTPALRTITPNATMQLTAEATHMTEMIHLHSLLQASYGAKHELLASLSESLGNLLASRRS